MVPSPRSCRGCASGSPGVIERRQQPAAVEQGNEMAAATMLADILEYNQRGRIEGNLGAEFRERTGPDAVGGQLLVSDDAAGNVPAWPEELIVAPGEQGATGFVLN